MADIKAKVIVDDNGSTAKVTKNAEALRKSLEASATAATKIRVPLATQAARQGVAASAAPNNQKTGESGLARSIGPGTGAEGRDFAKQAAGLGGLVHLYATFAANIFAVSAAFGALSRTADTTNLVKGLDQLGAQGGRNLGSLAKELSRVTDGAISMRDALIATSQGSAGGLSGTNILRLGQVAKQASQALGVAMPDALSRLTRGITKLEPELLDEIGILVRVDKASQDYARTIGKTAATLSDFEKRQGFANAVLEQGEKKFGAIDIDANPYSKVLASISNLSQSGLELINKVLGPLVNYLSSSPVALGTALAAITGLLLKQAIPALGAYRQSLAATADESRKKLTRLYNDQQALAEEGDNAARVRAENLFRNEVGTQKKLADLRKSFTLQSRNGSTDKTDYNALLKKDALDLTNAELALFDKKVNSLSKRKSEADRAEGVALKQHLGDLRKIRQEQEDVGLSAVADRESRDNKLFSTQSQLIKNLDKANQQASSRRIISLAAETTATLGPIRALKELNAEIAKSKIKGGQSIEIFDPKTGETISRAVKETTGFFGAIQNGATRAKGVLTIATTAVSTFVNAFSGWLVAIGLVIGAIGILDGYMSTSKKEANAFSSAIDSLDSSFSNVTRTLEAIDKKPFLEMMSVESIQARANALNELNDNLSGTLVKFTKLQEAQGGWDKFFDGLWDMFGKGSGDMLAKGISGAVVEALKVVEDGPAKEKAKETIESILGQKVDFTSISKFNDSIKDLDKTILQSKGKQLATEISKLALSAGNSAASLTALKLNLGEVNKQFDTMANSIKATDDFSKIGSLLTNTANSLGEALKNPVTGLTALLELSGDMKTLSLLPPDTAEGLGMANKALAQISANLSQTKKEIEANAKAAEEAQKKYNALTQLKSKDSFIRPSGISDRQVAAAKQNVDITNETSAYLKARLKGAELERNAVVDKYKELDKAVFGAGIKNLSMGLTKAIGEAGIIAGKGYLDVIKGFGGGTARLDEILQKRAIDLQIEDIKAKYNNTEALVALTIRMERNTASIDAARLQTKIATASDSGNDPTGLAAALEELSKLEIKIKGLDTAEKAIKAGSQAVIALAKQAANADKNAPDSGLKEAAAQTKAIVEQAFGKAAALAKLGAERKSITVSANANADRERNATENRAVDEAAKLLAIETAQLNNRQALVVESNLLSQIRKEQLAIAEVENKFQKQTNDLATNKLIAERTIKELESKSSGLPENARLEALAGAKKALAELDRNEDNLRKERETALATTAIANVQQRIAVETSLFNIRVAHAQRLLDAENAIKLASLDTDDAVISSRKALGTILDSEVTNQTRRIGLSRQEIAFQKESLNITNRRDAALIDVNARLATAKDLQGKAAQNIETPTGLEEYKKAREVVTEIANQRERILVGSEAELKANDAINASKIKTLDLAKFTADELERQANLTKDLQSLTESLGEVFGDIGSSLGAAVTALENLASTETKYLKGRNDLEKERQAILDRDDVDDPQKKIADLESINKKIAASDKKNTKDQLSNTAAVANASKKMFSEKTFAYKALSAIEKVIHIAKIAMMIKEAVVAVTTAGTVVAADGAKAASGGVTAIINALKSLPPPFSFIAGAAMAAVVASVLGGGKKNVPVPAGLTAADRQEVQGTGTSFRDLGDGKGIRKVENGGGVFGDSEAKSESIVNSLEIIKDNTIEGLAYDNKMLKALESINKGIGAASISLYSIAGLRTGSTFGTKEGTNSSGGFLGISGLFGKTKTSEIVDSGVSISGTFKQLMESTNGLIKVFERVSTTTVSSGFFGIGGGTKTSISTNTKQLDQDLSAQISGIFKNAGNAFVEVGKKLGIKAEDTIAKLATVQFDGVETSLRGLKGEELEKEFAAVIGNLLDSTATTLFKSMEKYRKFGEGMLETVVRVVDSNEKIKVALNSIGVKTEKEYASIVTGFFGLVTTIKQSLNFDVTEELAGLAGGLEEFTSQVKFFSDEFLSESERLAPISKNVIDTLTSLITSYAGVNEATKAAAIDTREEFKLLVQSLDLTTVKGREMYQGLQDIAPAFAKVYPEITKTASSLADLQKRGADLKDQYDKLTMSEAAYNAQLTKNYSDKEKEQFNSNLILEKEIALITKRNDLIKTFGDLEVDLLKAQGKELEATNLQRQKELALLDPSNRAIQNLIYSRQDEITALTKIKSLTASITTAFEQFVNTAKTTASTLKAEEDKIIAGFRTAQNSLADAQKAVIDAQTNLKNTARDILNSLASTVANFAETAKTASETLSAAAANISSGFVQATQALVDAEKGVENARNNITRNLISAQDAFENAEEAVASAIKNAANELASFGKTIKEFITSLTTTSLGGGSGAEQLKALKQQFASQSTLAAGGDKDALSKITSTAQQLLEVGKTQSATKLDFLRLQGSVTNTLGNIVKGLPEGSLESAMEDPILTAQKEANEALLELNRWQEAANAAQASSVLAEEDLLAEFKDAKALQATAQTELTAWQAAILESGAATTVAVTDYAKEWRDAQLANTLAQTNNNMLLASLAASSVTMEQINSQQATELSTFNSQLNDYAKISTALQDVSNTVETNILSELVLAKETLAARQTDYALWSDVVNRTIVKSSAEFAIFAEAVKASGAGTAGALEQYITDFHAAKEADTVAQANLLIAQQTAAGIAATQVTALESLNTLVAEYSAATAARDAAQLNQASATQQILIAQNTQNQQVIDLLAKLNAVTELSLLTQITIAQETAEAAASAAVTAESVAPLTSTSLAAANDPAYVTPLVEALTGLNATINTQLSAIDQATPVGTQIYNGPEQEPGYGGYPSNLGYIDSFASGGYHKGGLRIVGENGPELEMTGPSSIINNRDTKSLFNNDALIAEIQALRAEVASLRYSSERTEDNTRKTKETLTRVTRDGNSLLTQIAA